MPAPASDLSRPYPSTAASTASARRLTRACACAMDEPLGVSRSAAYPSSWARPISRTRSCSMATNVKVPRPLDERATYFVFAHIVEDRALELTPDFAGFQGPQHQAGATPGNDLGDLVAEYQLVIMRWQQRPMCRFGGASPFSKRASTGAPAPFAAAPHQQDNNVAGSTAEAFALGKPAEPATAMARPAIAAVAMLTASISGSMPCPIRSRKSPCAKSAWLGKTNAPLSSASARRKSRRIRCGRGCGASWR